VEKEKERMEIESLGVPDPIIEEYYFWREFWLKGLFEAIRQEKEREGE